MGMISAKNMLTIKSKLSDVNFNYFSEHFRKHPSFFMYFLTMLPHLRLFLKQ